MNNQELIEVLKGLNIDENVKLDIIGKINTDEQEIKTGKENMLSLQAKINELQDTNNKLFMRLVDSEKTSQKSNNITSNVDEKLQNIIDNWRW